MKRLLKYPITNATGLILFTGFYTLVFLLTPKNVWLYDAAAAENADRFWASWQQFLRFGYHQYIAFAMIALTVVVVFLLMNRSHAYDEYHTALLVSCLTIASILTLIAIAAFYLVLLHDATMAVAKFTLFIVVNWVTVVLSDLIFVFLCRWK